MRVQDQSGRNPVDPLIVDGVKLMQAFFKIADVADRLKKCGGKGRIAEPVK